MVGENESTKVIAVARRRNAVIAIAFASVLLEVLHLLINAWLGLPFFEGNIFRYVVAAVLTLLMYEGCDWARLILAFGAMVLTFFGLYMLYSLLINSPHLPLLLSTLVSIVLYGSIAAALMFLGDVSGSTASQRPNGWRWLTESRSRLSMGETVAYLAIFFAGSLMLFIGFIFSTDDCHGPGAAHPGGCPEFSAAVGPTFSSFFCAQFAVLVVLLTFFSGNKVRPIYRLIALALFGLFLFFGPSLINLLPWPPK